MAIDTRKEDTLRRYLLGEMPDEEREAVEERFLEDDSLFEELRSLEDELYLEYTAGELSGSERSAFEAKYMRTRRDRERLAFADAFLEITGDLATERGSPAADSAEGTNSFMRSIASFFRNAASPLQFGMTAALVLLVVGLGLVALQNAALHREVARFEQEQMRQKEELDRVVVEKNKQQEDIERRLNEERGRSRSDQQRIAEMEAERSRLRAEVEEARRSSKQLRLPPTRRPDTTAPQRSIIALALSPGRLVRGGNDPDASRITITSTTRRVQLNLNLKNVDPHSAYRAVITNVDNDGVAFTSGNLKSRNGRLTVDIPATRLERADYEITLLGVAPNGTTEEVTRYYFSISR